MKVSPAEPRFRIAVMPVENRSGTAAPLDEIRASLTGNLQRQGIEVLDDETLEQFRARHRVRYAGGLDTATSEAFKGEIGVDAVLITAVDLYGEQSPPRISLLSRLVATGTRPAILWMDGVGLTGDDSPGLLGLTRIEDPKKLREKAMSRLFGALAAYLGGRKGPDGARKIFQPKSAFRSPVVGKDLRENFVTFEQGRSSGYENAGPARLEVALGAVSGTAVTVEYAITGGTAVRGVNFKGKDGVLTFNPGETAKAIEIGIIENGLNENDKTIEVSLRNPKHALPGAVVMHTYTIINTDPEPTVTFTSAGTRVKENAGPVTVTARISAVSGKDVLVPFAVSGTAKTPADYTITPGPLVIRAGERSAAVTVSPAGNGSREGDRTVVLYLGLPTHATHGKTTMSTVTIINAKPVKAADKGAGTGADGNPDPTVEFTSAGSSGEEKAGVAGLEVALSAASGKVVRVEYAATGGTAIRGKDYALMGNTLTFNPGETKKTIEIDMKNNNVYDDDKTIEVGLKNPQNAVPGSVKTHIYTMVNTTSKPVAAFTVANQRVRKNAGRIIITVELSTVSGKDAIVPFTVGGTADQGKDYTMTPGPLVIKAGMRSAEIAITMKGGVPVETGRTIEVRLAEPSNAQIGSPGVFTLNIAKDTPPVIAIVPFVNVSNKKTAGELVMLHLVKELAKLEDFIIVEPGVVRQHLLSLRIIMYDGASLPDAELLIKNLDADLILTGKVFDYQDNEGAAMTPKVDFSVMIIEKTSRKVIWASKSYNQGDEGVTLFDWGNITTANALATEMVRAVRKMMVAW